MPSAGSRSIGRRCATSTAPSNPTSRAGASEVYLHEMPGGQFTNLKEQARSLGLETRWHEVARAYADVNMMFGDIVKVTPSSKVVGDLGADDGRRRHHRRPMCERPAKDIAFPDSVVSDAARRPRPAARRLAGGAAEEGAEGRGADHRPSRLAAPAPPTSTAEREASSQKARPRARRPRARLLAACTRRCSADFAAAQDTYGPVARAADAGLLLRPGRRARRSSSTSRRARRWSSAAQAVGETDDEGHGHASSSS